jgi:hypothetical protein
MNSVVITQQMPINIKLDTNQHQLHLKGAELAD